MASSRRSSSVADGEPSGKSFTTEGLFDYINESAAALARVVSEQRPGGKSKADHGDNGASHAQRMSLRASIRNRVSGRRVEYETQVDVFPVAKKVDTSPNSKRSSRRHSDGLSALDSPTHDHAKDNHRNSAYTSFWETLRPLFQRSDSKPESKRSSKASAENNLDLELEIELVKEASDAGDDTTFDEYDQEDEYDDDEENKDSANRKSGASSSSFWPNSRSTQKHKARGLSEAAAMAEVDHVYPPTRKKFAYKIPSQERRNRASQDLQNMHPSTAKLSASQASAAAAAGKVLVLRGTDGVAFGAAVKRKVQLRANNSKLRGRQSRLARPSNPTGLSSSVRNRRRTLVTGNRQRSRRNKKSMKRKPSLRTPGIGLAMRPKYIFFYYVAPLILLGINDMAPLFEHLYWKVTHPNVDYRLESSTPVVIPIWVRLIFPSLQPGSEVLKHTMRFGSYVFEFGGLLVMLQMLHQLVTLFRAGRDIFEVHASDSDDSDEETDFESEDFANEEPDYTFLFKWQAPRST